MKLLGPVHEYVAPVTAAVVSVIVDPAHNGPLLPGAGVAGIAFTVAVTAVLVETQPVVVLRASA